MQIVLSYFGISCLSFFVIFALSEVVVTLTVLNVNPLYVVLFCVYLFMFLLIIWRKPHIAIVSVDLLLAKNNISVNMHCIKRQVNTKQK